MKIENKLNIIEKTIFYKQQKKIYIIKNNSCIIKFQNFKIISNLLNTVCNDI